MLLVSGFLPIQSDEIKQDLKFSVMGCGPYDTTRRRALQQQLEREHELQSSEFIVHLGDIAGGRTKFKESHFSEMKKLLTQGNKVPTYIVPGDNEWNDQKNHVECWSFWMKHLFKLEDNFKTPWITKRQEIRPENFSFVHKGVLFIGLNLPGGTVHDADEWILRQKQNAMWVDDLLKVHGEKIRATVLFFQAALSEKHSVFTAAVRPSLKAFEKPVLLVHADHHKWLCTEAYLEANITRIQTDKIGPEAPPVQVTISKDENPVFKFNRRLKSSEGFVK
jgi:hypothetical protein